MAYSDGIDSRAVAGILNSISGNDLLLVRVGSKVWDRGNYGKCREPFTKVPFFAICNGLGREPSARSRGFKFCLISAIAAYLTNAGQVVIPESGQGAFGPVLVNVGHAYPDYRNHPLFTVRMQRFVNALFGTQMGFVFPRIWYTKGETLREYISVTGTNDWEATRSCWRSNRWSSVNGKLRQCGVCAACMLRRISVYAAGKVEHPATYVANNMTAPSLVDAIDRDFTRLTPAFRDYAIGGALHMRHLSNLEEAYATPVLRRHATLLSPVLELSTGETMGRLRALFEKHAYEWRNYLSSLGKNSFVNLWAQADQ